MLLFFYYLGYQNSWEGHIDRGPYYGDPLSVGDHINRGPTSWRVIFKGGQADRGAYYRRSRSIERPINRGTKKVGLAEKISITETTALRGRQDFGGCFPYALFDDFSAKIPPK